MKKIRLLVVVCWPVGGIRTFLRYVYRTFDPEGFQLTIIAPDQPELRVLLEDLSGLDVIYRRCSAEPLTFGFFAAVAREILVGKYNIVHSQGFSAGVYAALPSFLRGIKHVLTLHDVVQAGQFFGAKGFFKKGILSLALRSADLVHCVSYDSRENVFGHFPWIRGRGDKIVVIPNGIEAERFLGEEKRDLRQELGLGERSFLIGFFGRFMSQKGFRYLVDALDHIVRRGACGRDPVLITFGHGGFIREDMEYVRMKGLVGRVHYLPFQDNVASAIRGVDVVVMPSLWEACPLLAMETLVAGRPLIGTDCIGLREVLQGTPARVVPVRDGEAIALALECEIASPTTEVARKFREEATRRFNIKERAAEIQRAIFSLAGLDCVRASKTAVP